MYVSRACAYLNNTPQSLRFFYLFVCFTVVLWYHFISYSRLMVLYLSSRDQISTCATLLARSQDESIVRYEKGWIEDISVAAEKQVTIAQPPDGWSMPLIYTGNRADPSFQTEWPSQCGQDRTIFQLFKGKRNGFFVDLAANDAVHISNTLELEQRHGWRGICVEINPEYFDKLYLRRCQVVQAALGHSDNEMVDFSFKRDFSGIVGFDNKKGGVSEQTLITVSAERLFHDLSIPSVIDYMSLDIEGAEEWVFEAFPWRNFTFLAITVERPKKILKRVLSLNGYNHICDHGGFGDQLWLHSSFPAYNQAIAHLHVGQYFDDLGNVQCRENWRC